MESLDLLEDIQTEISNALNELGGTELERIDQKYILYMCVSINLSLEGYVFLRRNQRDKASRQLIRPAIEALIRIVAVLEEPELVYRIAHSEYEEDKTLARNGIADEKALEDGMKKLDRDWEILKEAHSKEYPESTLPTEKTYLKQLADKTGTGGFYDSHYRVYCRYTHNALSAATGGLSMFDEHDDRAMIVAGLGALDALKKQGATVPNLDSLFERHTALP